MIEQFHLIKNMTTVNQRRSFSVPCRTGRSFTLLACPFCRAYHDLGLKQANQRIDKRNLIG